MAPLTAVISFCLLAVLVCVVLLVVKPSWNVPAWTAGLFRYYLVKNAYYHGWDWDGRLLFHKDGIATTVTVEGSKEGVGVSLKVNGKVDASDIGEPSIMKLADALDNYIPEPERAIDRPFLMPVEDVFSISGRGTVVTGRVERGVVKVGEEIEIIGLKPTIKTICTGVEMFRKLLDQGQAGDNVGILLRGTKREEVERGQVLAKPGSITPHTKFSAEIYVLSKDEGGRHTPFFQGYRPQFYFRTTDVTGAVELPEGTEMVMPGDNVSVTVNLIAPIAMEEGLRFAIREGGRTVGAGVVAKVIE